MQKRKTNKLGTQPVRFPIGALLARPHAVTTAGTTTYCYDHNGNMTRRDPSGGAVYNFQYDAENRLVSASGSATASFVYDGDGVRVKGTAGGVTTAYIGSHFEWTGSTSMMMKYYYAGGARVAMRQGSTLYFLLTDHLGSKHKMANADGSNYTTHLYKAWGEKRYPSGASGLLTTFRFTGQREEDYIKLYFYGARWWDSSLSRFAQADTLIPLASQEVQAWDRYAGMNNNPIKFVDPDGHYSRNVHYDLTYKIVFETALAAAMDYGYSQNRANGFARRLAAEVGRGNMAADAQNPDGSPNLAYGYNQPLTCPGYVGSALQDPVNGTSSYVEYKTPHWYTTPEAEDELASTRDPFEFGVNLHKYQDSFSHWQKLGEPGAPQGIWAGHFGNQFTSRFMDASIDHYDPTSGKYKEIDRAMLTGMTEGFAFEQIMDLAWSQLER